MRLLLIRPGAIGDFIVSLPALRSFEADILEVWCAEANVPLAGFAQQARSLGSTGLDLLGLPGVDPPPELAGRLQSFDRVVSWYGANRPDFQQTLREIHPSVTFFPALPGGPDHAVDFYLRQVGRPAGAIPRIAADRAPARGTVVIHPFASSVAKRWPFSRFRALAELLPWPVEWCAGPEEPLEEAVRFTCIGQLARWLSGAKLYVGNDSGIAHLAAAVGVPVAVFFGPTDPAVWAPRGPSVTVLRQMETLSAEAAADAILAVPALT